MHGLAAATMMAVGAVMDGQPCLSYCSTIHVLHTIHVLLLGAPFAGLFLYYYWVPPLVDYSCM